MSAAIREMLESKKFLAALLAVLVWGLGQLGANMTPEQLAPLVGPLWLYILGQAWADSGKEAAKIDAGASDKADG